MKKSIILIITIFLVITTLIILIPNISNDYVKKGKLYITSVLAKNDTLKEDNNGEYSDYIELYNGYSYQINLKNYHLSDNEYETNKWTFPDIVINPKEHLIIYATGNDTCDIASRVCHTNFKLNSTGETITLTDNTGNIINKFTYPTQYPDVLYGYTKGKYDYLDKSIVKELKNIKVKNYELEITEYMTHNKRILYDNYGNYFDWIEIHNKSNDDYILEGLYLTDDTTNLKKYLIPKTELTKDNYLIIYLAGKTVNYDNGIYANFSLSDNDETIIISNGEKIIDKVEVVSLLDNLSYGKTKEGWKYFVTPTPGYANTTASFDTLGGTNGSS